MGDPCKAASLPERRIQTKTTVSSRLQRETKPTTRGSQALVQTGKSWCCCSRERHLLQQAFLWMGLFQVPPGMVWIYFFCRFYFIAVRRWIALHGSVALIKLMHCCLLYSNLTDDGIISCVCCCSLRICCYNLRCTRSILNNYSISASWMSWV